MNINSCSKAELIAQSQSAFDAAMKALDNYSALMKSYVGRPIGDIPDITLTKAAELSGAYEKHMRT